MKVTLIGLGMGDQATLTWEGRQALEAADMVIGAQRLLDSLPEEYALKVLKHQLYIH